MSSKWTSGDIPDLSGRRAVVTGANSGLGYVTARELTRHGADVVLACRDQGRGEQARARMTGEVTGSTPGRVELMLLDLADLASVRSFAGRYAERYEDLDLLVNNAGVMAVPLRRTTEGFELQLGTNHLGHFALTGLLLPRLLAAGRRSGQRGPARVVTVSSGAHRFGRIDLADLNAERSYRKWRAYGQAKLANLLFARELQRRADAAGAPLLSVAAHPGYAATNLQRRGAEMEGRPLAVRLNELANAVLAQPAEAGALPILYAATMPDVRGGEYFGPDGPLEARGHPTRAGTARAARDQGVARALWEESERLTGVGYDLPGVSAAPAG